MSRSWSKKLKVTYGPAEIGKFRFCSSFCATRLYITNIFVRKAFIWLKPEISIMWWTFTGLCKASVRSCFNFVECFDQFDISPLFFVVFFFYLLLYRSHFRKSHKLLELDCRKETRLSTYSHTYAARQWDKRHLKQAKNPIWPTLLQIRGRTKTEKKETEMDSGDLGSSRSCCQKCFLEKLMSLGMLRLFLVIRMHD